MPLASWLTSRRVIAFGSPLVAPACWPLLLPPRHARHARPPVRPDARIGSRLGCTKSSAPWRCAGASTPCASRRAASAAPRPAAWRRGSTDGSRRRRGLDGVFFFGKSTVQEAVRLMPVGFRGIGLVTLDSKFSKYSNYLKRLSISSSSSGQRHGPADWVRPLGQPAVPRAGRELHPARPRPWEGHRALESYGSALWRFQGGFSASF